ncbi:molybdenum cofactor guanylyltransferase [Clostridium sp.]|uniref:molybdenum cofactor guanylyltransferase n=1 Tax=Clostridium sp. TaxID=1506 RepID=UPI003F2EB60A
MINKTLAILAGGKSSRMNYNNKAFLKYEEKTFIERIIEAGKDFNEIIIIANNEEVYKEFGLKVFKDIHKDQGPLGGIHSALTNCKNDFCLCVACDMPYINDLVFNILGSINNKYDVLIPRVNERLQPLCSIYNKNIVNTLEEALIKKENKLQKLILTLNYNVIEGFLDKDFSNINTIEEYKKLEES